MIGKKTRISFLISLLCIITATQSVYSQVDLRQEEVLLELGRDNLELGTEEGMREAIALFKKAYAFQTRYYLQENMIYTLTQIANAYEGLSQADSALVYYGRSLTLSNPESLTAAADLLDQSPLLQPTQSIVAEARFVRDVKSFLNENINLQTATRDVYSAAEAMSSLELLLDGVSSEMEIKSTHLGLRVYYRRWLYRKSDTALWYSVSPDTTVLIKAATYQVRYKDPGLDEDVIINLQCADGCSIQVPFTE